METSGCSVSDANGDGHQCDDAQGVPALASPQPSYAELLADDQGGYLCADPEDWSRALDLVSSDREALSRQSRLARSRMAPFSTERIAMEYGALIEELSRELL